MSTRYEKFLPEVLPYVHDCPEFVAVAAIRNACIEFCDRTDWWLYTHDPITVVANQNTYELDLPDFTVESRILEGWYNNFPLKPKSEDQLRSMYNLDWRQMEGSPQFLTQLDPGEVIVVPFPTFTTTNTLNLIVVLKPTRDSVDVDDSIYERWAEQIGFGARARLYEIPNQPFYDPGSAAKYRMMFETAMGKAALERQRGISRANLRVRPPRFF